MDNQVIRIFNMSKRAFLLELFKEIADAIRSKTGDTRTYEIEELPDRIMDISTGATTPTQTKSVELVANGTESVVPDAGYLLSKVDIKVNVPQDNSNNALIETYSNGAIYQSIKSIDLSNVDFSKVTSLKYLFGSLYKLESIKYPNLSNLIYSTESMFFYCKSLKSVDISFLQGSSNIKGMFQDCISLESIKFGKTFDLSQIKTANDTQDVFYDCYALTQLDLSSWINTNSIQDMSRMFKSCIKLESLNISSFDTSNVSTFRDMFSYCQKLTSLDLRHFDVSKVTDFGSMFYGCSSLTSLNLDGWDTSNVTNMDNIFYACTSLITLNVNHFNIGKCSRLYQNFSACKKLESLDLSNWDTSNIVEMTWTFYGSDFLKTLNVSTWNTSKVTKMDNLFNQCNSLDNLDLSSWNTDNVTSMNNMFQRGNQDERNVTFGTNWASNEKLMSFDMSSWNLTHDSALDLLNKVAVRTNSPTLKFHSYTKPKLTADEIKIATDKGWVVA